MSQQLMDELSAEFWRTGGVMAFTSVGLGQFAAQTAASPTVDNPDPLITLSQQAPTDPGAVADASWRLSDLRGAAASDGWLQLWLTHAWIALLFSRWEDYYRPAFAASHGVAVKAVGCHVMGDIRLLRNDVLHHQGIATAKNTGRCQVMTHLEVGDHIILTATDVRMLRSELQVEIEVDAPINADPN